MYIYICVIPPTMRYERIYFTYTIFFLADDLIITELLGSHTNNSYDEDFLKKMINCMKLEHLEGILLVLSRVEQHFLMLTENVVSELFARSTVGTIGI